MPIGYKLNEKQLAFCDEYLRCYNYTKAYQTVYGVKKECAQVSGCRLLRSEEVKRYIREKQQYAVQDYGDINNLLISLLMEDAVKKSDEGEHSKTWQRSVELVQKQLGLQKSKVELEGQQDINITIEE